MRKSNFYYRCCPRIRSRYNQDLVEKGAYTIIADLNFEGAKETAKEFDQEFGEGYFFTSKN